MIIKHVRGQPSDELIDQVKGWSDKVIDKGLLLHVNVVRIYPEEISLSTFQFTERLEYRKENDVKMLTMGFYYTLKYSIDEKDRQVLSLIQKWMGNIQWYEDESKQDKPIAKWQCQRTERIF